MNLNLKHLRIAYTIIYDGMGLDKEVIGTYCGTNSPGTIVSKASSGCLTIQFVSDDDTSAAGWIATINCLDDGSCGNECPDGYSLSGVESGNGGPDNNGIYNANGSIHSTQEVLNGALIYNGKRSVYLNPEFLIENNATVEIYLDGCGTNSETKE